MNTDLEAIRLTPGQSLDDALFLNQVSPLATYLAHPEGFEPGAVVLAPAYRLEEVEEIVDPEKPGVTRRVKKWVKIDHPEVPSDGIA